MGYWHNARRRTMRRRSPWNLLLIPAAIVPWFASWWFSASVFGYIYHLLHPRASFIVLPDTLGGVLISVGLLFAWCPVAMMIGNLLVHAVPGARRALDQESSAVLGTDFRNANRGLMRVWAVCLPLGMGACLVGLFL